MQIENRIIYICRFNYSLCIGTELHIVHQSKRFQFRLMLNNPFYRKVYHSATHKVYLYITKRLKKIHTSLDTTIRVYFSIEKKIYFFHYFLLTINLSIIIIGKTPNIMVDM